MDCFLYDNGLRHERFNVLRTNDGSNNNKISKRQKQIFKSLINGGSWSYLADMVIFLNTYKFFSIVEEVNFPISNTYDLWCMEIAKPFCENVIHDPIRVSINHQANFCQNKRVNLFVSKLFTNVFKLTLKLGG